MSDLIDAMCDRLARGWRLSHDDIVLKAINARIGDVPIESLRGRLTRCTYTHDKRDEWYLDGVLLLTFYEPETELDGQHYTMTQKYRLAR